MENERPEERIARMEALYDALTRDPEDGEARRVLTEYMDSGLWLHDYELDEQGRLPRELKRGVLSQDGLYGLLMG